MPVTVAECTRAPGNLSRKAGAECVRLIDPQDLQLCGEECQLLKRQCETGVVRMTLDVRVELRREEIAFYHAALELRHIHAVRCESA